MAPEPLFPYAPGQPPEPLVPSYVVLQQYMARASVARQACPVDLTDGEERGNPSVLLWLGCLFVVRQGWAAERLRDDAVEPLFGGRTGFVDLLRQTRDVAFHYEPSLNPQVLDQAHATPGFLGWADQLHAAFAEALRKYAQASRIPAGLRHLDGQPRDRKRGGAKR